MKLSFKIKKNIDYTYDYLTDMQKFASAHPLISKIDKIGQERYLVHETLKFGNIPFSFTYPVNLEKCPIDKTIVIRAIVFKITKIEMKFYLKSYNDCTIIDEIIHFYSPLPIKFILQRVFKKQHEILFQNIEAN